jgi:ring-1,2-phenylacetyl-CoA epoxidase subunit PaaC
MQANLKNKLNRYLVAMGDDELVLGHRDSEWCGHAPILEEDIAFANIALDEIGHASVWYALAAELTGEDPEVYPDDIVFHREPEDFRNAQLLELPKGDWAFSMMRQYIFDSLENQRLEALARSKYQPLAEAAAKINNEEIYHLRHTSAWIKRLGLGTEESHRRLQAGLDEIWLKTGQLFFMTEYDRELASEGYIPNDKKLIQEWNNAVLPILRACDLKVPTIDQITSEQMPRDQHSPHLKVLVDEMQSVARLDREVTW